MKRIALALLLALGIIEPALAQAPPPVAALPDAERRISYSISGTTCACSVGFQLYGTGTDVDAWLEVWIAGVRYLSTDLTHGWVISSATGPLASIARPITNGMLTFNQVQTGVVQIVSAERPRRLSQFAENRGVAARDLNLAFTDIVATQRDTWDKTNDVTGRTVLAPPGETFSVLPPAATRAGMIACFDPITGNITTCASLAVGTTLVAGAGISLSGSTTVTISASSAINSQTAAYGLATTDCGKTVALGGSAFYALTVGPAAGFPATCTVSVANIDTGRGKTMTINGTSFPNSGILWPLQTFTLKNISNVWTIINPPGRWKLTVSTTFRVDAAGSDTNDGLATGATGAFQTIGGALSVIQNVLDANFQGVLVQTLCGGATYSENVNLPNLVGAFSGGGLGSNTPTLIGDTATKNCFLTGTSAAGTISKTGPGNDWIVRGYTVTSTGAAGPCVGVDAMAWIRLGEMTYNGCSNQLNAQNYSIVEPMAAYTISGSPSGSHAFTVNGGSIQHTGELITLTGTPNFPGGFTFAIRNSFQNWIGVTFSGSATGVRFLNSLGGGIETSGGGATFFPGNAGGTTTAPGWYN